MTTINADRKNKKIFESHTYAADRTVKGVVGEMYGLEMEVLSRYNKQAIADVANEGEDEIFVDLEDDGSLNWDRGLELVSRGPVPVSKLLNQGWLDRILNRIVSQGGVEFGRQPDGYGLHININCAGWSWEEKNAFCAAVVLMPNVNKEVATRSRNGQGDYNTPLHVYGRRISGSEGESLGSGDTRPFGYNSRDFNTYIRVEYNHLDCIECRIFRMNTDPEVIRGYIKHIQELRKFSLKYKSILLYLAAASATFEANYPIIEDGFEKTNAYLENLWANRATTTPTQAAAALPAVNATHISIYGEHYLAIFDPAKTFRQRATALLLAWHSPQPADLRVLTGDTPWDEEREYNDPNDDDDDGWDDDYCCEECNGPRSQAA